MKSVVLSCLIALFAVSSLCAQSEQSKRGKNVKQKVDAVEKRKNPDGKGAENTTLEQDAEKLKAEKERLQKELEKLQSRYNALDEKLKGTKKLLDNELENGNSVKLERQIEGLEADSATLSGRMETVADSLAADFMTKKEQLCNKMAVDSVKIVKLNEKLVGIDAYKESWFARLVDEVENKWLKSGYSDVDSAALEAAYSQCAEYAAENNKVAAAKEKLAPFVEEYRLFDKGTKAVNAPYDNVKVNSLISPVREKCASIKDNARKEEMNMLAQQLAAYGEAVKGFRKLCDDIAGEVKDLGTDDHSIAIPIVEAVLKKGEREGVVAKIQYIPWLKEQYKLYVNSLNENCIEPVEPQLEKK